MLNILFVLGMFMDDVTTIRSYKAFQWNRNDAHPFLILWTPKVANTYYDK